jgi:hypothetical protein
LLQTLPAVKAELQDTGYTNYWREETRRILSGPSDLDSLTDQSLLPNGPGPLHPPSPISPAPAVPLPAQPVPANVPAPLTAVSSISTPSPAAQPPPAPATQTSAPALATPDSHASSAASNGPPGTISPHN